MTLPQISTQHVAYDIALTLIDKIGQRDPKALADAFGSAAGVFETYDAEIKNIVENNNLAQIIIEGRRRKLEQAYAIFEQCTACGIKIITRNDPRYPQLLNQCADAPYLLYVRGDADLNDRKFIACVGTRQATMRGIDICNQAITDLAKTIPDITIISGLAFGIDKAAHQAAIENNLPTIAVMAGWVDDIVPRAHFALARQIVNKGGAIVSEMPPNTTILGPYFLNRNRIIAGMAHATFVAQSKSHGGSMVTADIANSYDREVFAPVGDSLDESFKGNHNLIKNNRAQLYQSSQDIANIMDWQMGESSAPTLEKLSPELLNLYALIPEKQPVSIDMVAQHTNTSVAKISAMMTMLELQGYVKTLKGRLFIKN